MEVVILLCAAALIVLSILAIVRHDWVRVARPSVRVQAKVVGHRSNWDDGAKVYAARMAFDVDGQVFEVTDQRLRSEPVPAIGTEVWLRYPLGRPELARISRPVSWALAYGLLFGLLGVVILRLFGRLG